MRLVFATHNDNKVKELRDMLPQGSELLSLKDLNYFEEIEETGDTIEENSLIKAKKIYQQFGEACFADDSGLEVDALDGEPGVRSARYAGPDRSDEANIQKLLLSLSGKEHKGAQFKSVITLIEKSGREHQFTGIVRGEIISSKRGSGGFGYDPIFVPQGFSKTFAEMDSQDKHAISHRGRAVSQLLAYLIGKNTDI